MGDPVKRLQYLHDNCADAEDREALAKAIKALHSVYQSEKLLNAKERLDCISSSDPELASKVTEATKDLHYPEHEWIPCNFRKILENLSLDTWKPETEGITCFNFSDAILDKPLHVLEDDGMGYGAFNTYAFLGCIDHNEARVWI